uniref:DUF1618 domain-containing protein n=1 Tax=Aegilops tauschii subsp. strangulata TaxID=200361 RepID=A0A453DA46_AEGTS
DLCQLASICLSLFYYLLPSIADRRREEDERQHSADPEPGVVRRGQTRVFAAAPEPGALQGEVFPPDGTRGGRSWQGAANTDARPVRGHQQDKDLQHRSGDGGGGGAQDRSAKNRAGHKATGSLLLHPVSSLRSFLANRLGEQVPRHSRYIDSMPSLHGYKEAPLAISVPPTDLHLLDGEDAGDLYIIDSVLHPNKADVRPQFEALVWRGITTSLASHRFWHCDILPLPPWITHHRNAFVYGHALVGDTICFSISGSEGHGTYCFHMATREWSKAGDWLMPFHGKADYVPELGLWFGVADDLPCAADLSGVVEGEEPPPKKMRIWVHDDLPEEWQPSQLFKPRVISLGSGKFMVVDFLDDMQFDKESNEMYVDKQFALFTGMEVAYSNGNGKGKNSRNGAIKNNDHSSGKGKGLIRGLRMIKHKSGRYLFNNQQRIEEVL